jgi:hypothetical protein
VNITTVSITVVVSSSSSSSCSGQQAPTSSLAQGPVNTCECPDAETGTWHDVWEQVRSYQSGVVCGEDCMSQATNCLLDGRMDAHCRM